MVSQYKCPEASGQAYRTERQNQRDLSLSQRALWLPQNHALTEKTGRVGKHELSNLMGSAQKLAPDRLSNDSC